MGLFRQGALALALAITGANGARSGTAHELCVGTDVQIDGALNIDELLSADDAGLSTHAAATFSVSPLVSTLCDMNNDVTLDLVDVSLMELALTLPADYIARYPALIDWQERGDANGDRVFNNFDLQPFVNRVSAGAQIPEPAGWKLAAGAFLGMLYVVWRQGKLIGHQN